jgi:hypothetical protein
MNIQSFASFDEIKNDAVVEIYPPASAFQATLGNFSTTYDIRWLCAHCQRTEITQLTELSITPRGGAPLQPVKNGPGEWIASASLHDLLTQNGVALRPLFKRLDYWSIVPQEFRFCEDIDPARWLDDTCPGCEKQSLVRTEMIAGVTHRAERPLTVTKEQIEGIIWGRSPQAFQRFHASSKPRNEPGGPAPCNAWVFGDGIQSRMNIMSVPLLKTLLDAGVHDLAFRPVNVI